MNGQNILSEIEHTITDQKEREYFWTHEERYKKILNEVGLLVTLRNTQNQNPKTDTIRILDVGCFPYHLGFGLEKMGFEVYGISSQHEPLQSDKISICNIENDKFPFKDNFFDIVIFTEVLEHLPQSPLFTLRQIQRVLKPGGSVILTTPNIARSINRGKLLLGKSVTYPLQQLLEQDGKGSNIYHRHNREYTLSECVQLTIEAKFTITKAETFVSYTPSRRRAVPDPILLKVGKIANFALMMMVTGLRDTLLIVGRK